MRIRQVFKLSAMLGLTLGAAVTTTAIASPMLCNGTIARVLMYSDGTLMILGSWRGDYTVVCSTAGTFGGIDTTTCLAWYGAALKARSEGTTVWVYYANDGGNTCANMPTYGSALIPYYFMVGS